MMVSLANADAELRRVFEENYELKEICKICRGIAGKPTHGFDASTNRCVGPAHHLKAPGNVAVVGRTKGKKQKNIRERNRKLRV